MQAAYGTVELHDEALLLRNLAQLSATNGGVPVLSRQPRPMEGYGLAFGMLAYTYAAPQYTLTI